MLVALSSLSGWLSCVGWYAVSDHPLIESTISVPFCVFCHCQLMITYPRNKLYDYVIIMHIICMFIINTR